MNTRGEDARNALAGLFLSGVCRAGDGREDAPDAGTVPPGSAASRAHARKMQALGMLAGGVAHDFNNLLHVIRNSVEILECQDPPADAQRHLGMIRRSAERGAELTQHLLAFARRSPPESRPFDPNELVAGVAELLRSALGGRITVQTTLARGIWPVAADAGELETALLNLAINARDAISGAGRVSIETANARLGEATQAAGCQKRGAGQYVMIAVTDTGSGMPPQVIEHACEPFFTTKAPGEGTGLGLSQVAGFAHRAGGRVEISSAEGSGTTVRMFLPKCAPLAAGR